MPLELHRAHQANDRAVMTAYGFPTTMTESDCVARLLEMYQQLTKNRICYLIKHQCLNIFDIIFRVFVSKARHMLCRKKCFASFVL